MLYILLFVVGEFRKTNKTHGFLCCQKFGEFLSISGRAGRITDEPKEFLVRINTDTAQPYTVRL